MNSLIETRDELVRQLENEPGIVSVGIARKEGDLVLLVATNGSSRPNIPERFGGIGVVVEDLGDAHGHPVA